MMAVIANYVEKPIEEPHKTMIEEAETIEEKANEDLEAEIVKI